MLKLPRRPPVTTKEEFEYRLAFQLLGDPTSLIFHSFKDPSLMFRVAHLGGGRFQIGDVAGWFTLTQVIQTITEGKFPTPNEVASL